jgi:hypothetical protein
VLIFSENVEFVAGGQIRIINDNNDAAGAITGKTGYYGEALANSFTFVIPEGFSGSTLTTELGSLRLSDKQLIINPSRDLDFANNYHIEISGNALRGKTSGQNFVGISNATDLNFSTVTPSQDKDVTKRDAAGGLSQKFTTNGELVPSFVWKDTEAWPSGGKEAIALEVNLGGSSIALLIGDQNANAATVSDTNIGVRNFHLKLASFGVDDLLYVDDLGRNEDAKNALDRIFDIQRSDNPDLLNTTDFDFDAATQDFRGGRLTIVGQGFIDLSEWITILGGPAAMPLGTPILFA